MINDPFAGVDTVTVTDGVIRRYTGQALTDMANPGAALAELIASNPTGATHFLRTLSTGQLSRVMGAAHVLADLAEQLYDERWDAELAAEEARAAMVDDDLDVDADHEPLRCELDYQDGVCLAPLNSAGRCPRGGHDDASKSITYEFGDPRDRTGTAAEREAVILRHLLPDDAEETEPRSDNLDTWWKPA